MVERTKSGYHLSGDDSIEFYRKLHDPTEKEISINARYFDELDDTVHITWLNEREFIAEIDGL